MKVILTAEIGASVREVDHILPLHLFSDCFSLFLWIMQRDFVPDLLFTEFGVQYMTATVELQLVVVHGPTLHQKIKITSPAIRAAPTIQITVNNPRFFRI